MVKQFQSCYSWSQQYLIPQLWGKWKVEPHVTQMCWDSSFPLCKRVYGINYSMLTWFFSCGVRGGWNTSQLLFLNVSLWNKMLNEHAITAAGRRVLWSISHMNTWVGFYLELQLNVTSTVPLVKRNRSGLLCYCAAVCMWAPWQLWPFLLVPSYAIYCPNTSFLKLQVVK